MGLLPLRLGVPPEVTLITLRRGPSGFHAESVAPAPRQAAGDFRKNAAAEEYDAEPANPLVGLLDVAASLTLLPGASAY